jgi:Domain of unknown function (DUF4956)
MNELPDWMINSLDLDTQIPLLTLLARFVSSFLLGTSIAAVYLFSRRGQSVAPSFAPTLVLLAMLIAVVTQVIGDNIARAFSLVGALSIVRFRTAVEDTFDIAFVIFAVVTGMAVGAENLQVAFVGVIFVSAAILISQPFYAGFSVRNWSHKDSKLKLRIDAKLDYKKTLSTVFSKNVVSFHLLSVDTGRGGAALDLQYRVRLFRNIDPIVFVTELNSIEGIDDIELIHG